MSTSILQKGRLFGVVALMLAMVFGVFATTNNAAAEGEVPVKKSALCHATGEPASNTPLSEVVYNGNDHQEVAVESIVPDGHAVHQNGKDIIPPFYYEKNDKGNKTLEYFPGLNWTEEGQAIFNNGCKAVTTEPTPTPSPTATETPTPSPTATETETPTETPTATETETPTATETETPTETATATQTEVVPTATSTPAPPTKLPTTGSGNGGNGSAMLLLAGVAATGIVALGIRRQARS